MEVIQINLSKTAKSLKIGDLLIEKKDIKKLTITMINSPTFRGEWRVLVITQKYIPPGWTIFGDKNMKIYHNNGIISKEVFVNYLEQKKIRSVISMTVYGSIDEF